MQTSACDLALKGRQTLAWGANPRSDGTQLQRAAAVFFHNHTILNKARNNPGCKIQDTGCRLLGAAVTLIPQKSRMSDADYRIRFSPEGASDLSLGC